MVQLRVLSGKMAGENILVRHFPFRIGRAAHNELCLGDDGVWDDHLTLDFVPGEGFTLAAAPRALAAVNDQPQTQARLNNGDMISFGSAKVQFWLAPAQLRRLTAREVSVWVLLAVVVAVEVAVMVKLAR
jgi:pSer/pThr/pTyr-binding forkhead associated (FHA) protein